ncbi:MAG: T9SS type A sorting domain-containing protein [Bacteroidia bacterium]|nr:T9SS type A sorting domain-containing protein [Bacteroidia bacterium]
MKTKLILLTLLWGTFTLQAQNPSNFTLKNAAKYASQPVHRCGQPAVKAWARAHDPGFTARRAAIEAYTQQVTNDPAFASKTQTEYTIPVVVHVIYRNSTQNISDAQIQSQIDVLNKDYRRLNTDASNTPSAFLSVAADVEFNFCLAQTDPQGAPSTGITRTSTTVSEIGNTTYYSTAQGGKDPWNTTKYMNIWVCEIESGGDLLGFAYLPGDAPSVNEDGVVIDYRYFGTQGTVSSPLNKGRTCTHEVGHYFNLEHIWGEFGGCNDDDFVNDTPMQDAEYYGCPGSGASCGSNDMYMNYMDYTDDACMNLFTAGQKARMVAAVTGPRKNLLTTNACSVASGLNPAKSMEDQVVVYPNPSRDVFQVEWNANPSQTSLFTVYNLMGQPVVRKSISNSVRASLDLSGFEDGIYLMEIQTENQKITRKLVKH